MIYLSKSKLISLHERLIELFGGSYGIRNNDMLELNGYQLEYKNEELIDIIMTIATSNKNESDLLNWVKQHIVNN